MSKALAAVIIIVIKILLSATLAFSQDKNKEANNDGYGAADTSYSSVALDLALVQKMRADEMFIRGQSCGIRLDITKPANLITREICSDRALLTSNEKSCPTINQYCSAYWTANSIKDESLIENKKVTKNLILKDTEYRILLIGRGIPFWGGAKSLTPGIPSLILDEMENLLLKFEKDNAEMQAFLSSIGSDKEAINRLKSYAEGKRGQFQSQSIQATRADIVKSENQKRERKFDSRIEGLERQRKALETEAKKLSEEATQIVSVAEAAILNAVAGSVGVPPGLLDAVSKGDIKAAAVSALSNGAVKSEITQIVKSFGETTAQFVEVYQQADELSKKIESGRELADQAKDFLRKPSVDKLARLGSLVSPYLDAKRVKEINEFVDKAAPVVSLVDSIRTLKGASPSEVCRTIQASPLVQPSVGIVDRAACGMLELTLPKACDRQSRVDLPQHCSKLGMTNDNLCKALNRGCKIQDALADHLAELSNDSTLISIDAQNAILAIIDRSGEQYLEVYAGAVKRLAEMDLSDRELRLVISEVFRLWSGEVIKLIFEVVPSAHRQRLLDQFASQLGVQYPSGLPDDKKRELLAKALADKGIERLPSIQVAGGQITVEIGPGIAPLQLNPVRILDSLSVEKIGKGHLQDVRSDVRRSFAKLGESTGAIRKALLRHIAPEATEALIERGIEAEAKRPGKSAEQARRTVWAELSKQSPDVAAYARDVAVGRTVATDVRPELELPPSEAIGPGPAQATDAPSMEKALAEQAMKRALDAALPGAGVALEVVQGLAKLSANIEQQRRIGEDSVRLGLMMLEAQDHADEAQYKSVLAEKDHEIALALREAANRQIEIYSFGIKTSSENAALARSKIKLRRAHAFYTAESLREQFDLFNRSMAMWSGVSDQPANYLARYIQGDPGRIRLALDPQIHLYDWLNREGEATRTDVDALMLHWRQLVHLARDLCRERGCAPGGGRLGQAGQTSLLKLRDLVSAAEFSRFRRWQSSPGVDPFQTEILIHPGLKNFPAAYRNLRFLDIRAGWKSPQGELTVIEGLEIQHPGTALVSGVSSDDIAATKFEREIMIARSISSFNLPEPFDLEGVRNRWSEKNRQAGILEGLGLYTVLSISIKDTEAARLADDLFLRVAFFYTDPKNIFTEQEFISKLSRLQSASDPSAEIYFYTLCSEQTSTKKATCETLTRAELPTFAVAVRPAAEAVPPGRSHVRSIRACNKPLEVIRSDLKSYYSSRELSNLKEGVSLNYAQLSDLQIRVNASVNRKIGLFRDEFKAKAKDGQLNGCPYIAEAR